MPARPYECAGQLDARQRANRIAPYQGGVADHFLAGGMNDAGRIVGSGTTKNGETHAYLATPAQTKAIAGPKDQAVTQRDGTQSTSVDTKDLTYSWTIPQGSPGASISGANTATPTVMLTMLRGTYTFQLTVTDSQGSTSSDLATVRYLGN